MVDSVDSRSGLGWAETAAYLNTERVRPLQSLLFLLLLLGMLSGSSEGLQRAADFSVKSVVFNLTKLSCYLFSFTDTWKP